MPAADQSCRLTVARWRMAGMVGLCTILRDLVLAMCLWRHSTWGSAVLLNCANITTTHLGQPTMTWRLWLREYRRYLESRIAGRVYTSGGSTQRAPPWFQRCSRPIVTDAEPARRFAPRSFG
jgi:hypothetical protein